MLEAEPLYTIVPSGEPLTPAGSRGVPGHFILFEAIGDVVLIHHNAGGKIAGVLIRINLGEPVDIVILADSWPGKLVRGCRLWVRGRLGQEREVVHRKNVHFVQADHVRVVRAWKSHK